MTKGFGREYLRSPLSVDVLFVANGHVHKARTVNISEGGVLLEALPMVPEINAMPLMLPLVQFPSFSKLSHDFLKTMKVELFERTVIRSKARLVRSLKAFSAADKVFVPKIGCEFVLPNEDTKKEVADYVVMSAKNIVFLLGLFERSANVDLTRNVAKVLGYDSEQKMILLRQKILHDYQSLESL
jgi:hypothetical protein